ncbi:MAG: hypothetical protein HOP24_05215 [Sideroxydans sp.]|nr:hypothetical protein [Sideroxydans sp.]
MLSKSIVRNVFHAAVLLLTFISLTSCDDNTGAAPVIPPQDAAWSHIINAHSSGIISRKSPIRIVFNNDIVSADRVGQSAEGRLKTDPSIKGALSFASQREIILTPDNDLQQGSHYRITLNTDGLLNMVETLHEYEFVVQVQAQQFEVDIAGLIASPASKHEMILKGSVITADVDVSEKIEKLLEAKHLDKPLAITWQHNPDAKHHEFTAAGIVRQAATSNVVLKWNGAEIGVENQGERLIEVPDVAHFSATQASIANTEAQPFVQVFFSDNLDAQQNLQGMVRLGSDMTTTLRIEGNVLKVYPDREVQGAITLTLEPGIRNVDGARTQQPSQYSLNFGSSKPQVRFIGKGVILPDNPVLSVPFEAVNVRSVRVTAMRIYENNVGQFLQVNKLDGNAELARVGRFLWRKTIPLSAPSVNQWQRYQLDVTELFQKHPGGLFRLTLSISKADSTYPCSSESTENIEIEAPPANSDDLTEREASSWDYAEDYYNSDGASNWQDRENPCTNAYYRFNANRNYGYQENNNTYSIRDERNFLASNIGLIAKRDAQGKLLVIATDLKTSATLKGVKISTLNFQNQIIATESTDGDGMTHFKPNGTPFYLLAEKDGQKGYLKIGQGVALPVSHFDVGGEKVAAGIKGFIYGERGVWRPGDDIFLTFVLQDKGASLPANHPVTMELRNPQGQLVQTLVNASPVGGFYKFTLKTEANAPTGNWGAKAILGGASFTKSLKIETVMPNRLKVEAEVGKLINGAEPFTGQLAAQWLTGASAAGLKADVELRLTKASTQFSRYADFVFDDPAREFSAEPTMLFDGMLDESGKATFEHEANLEKQAPGMLNAALTSRVFENGGAFSINRQVVPFSPYARYLGIKLPKGDATRNMLLTDKKHVVEIASLTADGKPTSIKKVQVTLYKIDWKWWWDQSNDSLAQYASSAHSSKVYQSTIATTKGKGDWDFEIKYPQWGRYLVRACDMTEGTESHCTGSTFYIDWPGWAGRAQEQSGPGASMLTFQSDKPKYNVGEKAIIQLPEATQGRALVTIENGANILEARWVEFSSDPAHNKEKSRFEIPITRAMTPNVYVSVTLIQPHEGKKNDLPIRMYGVIPLHVSDPETLLKPVLHAAEEWKPEAKVAFEVSETNGREMAYTVAVVDEGLLGLTNFKTPELHSHFYQREALGITTWDLFDEVAGAYGAKLDRLLAIGGSDADVAKDAKREKKRFPPVVKYFGPFKLAKGEKAKHEFQLPAYVGAVRLMLIAANANPNGAGSAYGSTEKSVYVRQPLMLMPTLPRVVGPEEEFTVPVSIFVMDNAIKEVTLKLEAGSEFELVNKNPVSVTFDKPDEKLGMLKLKSGARLGKGSLKFVVTSGKHQAHAEVFLEVRSPNPPSTRHQRKALAPGETWETEVLPHGLPATNVTTLEMSAMPPLDLERHLQYLIRYPHGCVEQTTSAAFPQLYLASLTKLEDSRKKEIESNVQAALGKLRGFQQPNGAFDYWPGGFNAVFDEREAWSTNYVGHFMVEANKLGYQLPPAMLTDWVRFQKSAAQAWSNSQPSAPLNQAYRLYTLALASQPELGAMNRLRETTNLPTAARWMLAASYKLVGQDEVANQLAKGDPMNLSHYAQPDATFGSRLRDAAIVLNSLVILNQLDQAKPLVDEISAQLASDNWYSTQSLSYSLMAMSKFAGSSNNADYSFERTVIGKAERVKSSSPIHTSELKNFPDQGGKVILKNTSERSLFATIVTRGIAKAGMDEAASSGLSLEVSYHDEAGNQLDISHLKQGQDVIAKVTVKNLGAVKVDNLALTQMVAAAYEIHNERMEGVDNVGTHMGQPIPTGYNPFGAPVVSASTVEHLDIRDDRVLRYFGLKAGESMQFSTRLNAAYLGHFYQPSIVVEAMYDATKNARSKGLWIDVTATAP